MQAWPQVRGWDCTWNILYIQNTDCPMIRSHKLTTANQLTWCNAHTFTGTLTVWALYGGNSFFFTRFSNVKSDIWKYSHVSLWRITHWYVVAMLQYTLGCSKSMLIGCRFFLPMHIYIYIKNNVLFLLILPAFLHAVTGYVTVLRVSCDNKILCHGFKRTMRHKKWLWVFVSPPSVRLSSAPTMHTHV